MTSDTSSRATHREFDELAVGWSLRALEPDDEARFARHLPDCPRCLRTVRDAEELAAGMALSLPSDEPSPDLRGRILAAAASEPRQSQSESTAPREDRAPVFGQRRRVGGDPQSAPGADRNAVVRLFRSPALLRTFAAAAAMTVIVGLGLWNVRLDSQNQDSQALATQQAKVLDELSNGGVYRLAPLESRDGRSVGTVMVHDGGARVMSNGLAVNDTADSTYVLWGLRDELFPVALGTFDVTTAALDVRPVGSVTTGADQYGGYAVSLEPGRSAPSTPTDVIATGTVGS